MTLIDIEILVERARGASAKSFIQEAVNCYKVGAYRSCVVATWIALIYDFVDKFRELALSGDGAAQKLVSDFDRIQNERDTTAALKFERDVLDIARDEYELLSSQEYVDLKRLFEDRNRFGHPNINQDSETLNATPELARTHLRNAVEHVMGRPPVQGKVAIQAVRTVVESQYFPRNVDDAVASLTSTPLVRAKRALVREFFLGCIISLSRERLLADAFEGRVAAALACFRMHHEVVQEVIAEKAQAVLDKTTDDDLGYVIVLLTKMPELVRQLSGAMKVRLKAYVREVPEKELAVLNFATDLNFLDAEVRARLELVTSTQLQSFVQAAARLPSRPIIDRAIGMLEMSKSWDSSNALTSAISEKMLEHLSSGDAERLLAAAANNEVRWSFNYPPLLMKLIDHKLLTSAQVREFAGSVGAASVVSALDARDDGNRDEGN